LTLARLQQRIETYLYFYHLGVAATLSEKEHDAFWDFMRIAAVNKQPPSKWNLPAAR
jgi:hypothetical protein